MATPHSAATDELDRLFRHLVLNLAQLDPSRIHGPVEIAELYQRLVPYRTPRASLALASHDDYQMTVMRLLSGERGYAFVEPEEVRAALVAEVGAINPDPGLFERYPTATVTLDPEQVRAVLAGETDEHPAPPPEPGAERPAPIRAAPPADSWFPELSGDEVVEAAPPVAEPEAAMASGELPFAREDEPAEAPPVAPRSATAPCAFCGGALPGGRAVIYCPHCGQNVGVVHCPNCGTELDVGWRYCITCGRPMGEVA